MKKYQNFLYEKYQNFLSEKSHFLVVKFSVYLRVFVMEIFLFLCFRENKI